MKKIYILLIICYALAYSAQVVADACHGDVVLSSQAAVDSFNCTEVTGRLTVAGPEITNIDALSQLKSVRGLIIENTSIPDVNGLSYLTEISSIISIKNNARLQNLDGLSGITAVNAAMEITGNPVLESINGFSRLIIFGTSLFFTISNNESLVSIDGFRNVGSFVGEFANITIENNPSLTNLDGFKSLRRIYGISQGASLNILNNPLLMSIGGLSSLTTISGNWGASLRIEGNPSLKNLDGLNSLSDFGGGTGSIPIGSISIVDNATLENIDALSRLSVLYIGTFKVTVDKNPLLKRCCGLYKIFNSMRDLGILDIHLQNDFIRLSENGSGCTVDGILAGGACTQMICAGDITLFSQSEVDAFGCSEVVGSLHLTGTDIYNLEPLRSLRIVRNNFSVAGTLVKKLDGLSSLQFIGGDLQVYSNDSLVDVTAFDSLKRVGSMSIYSNRMLASFPGFTSLTEVSDGGIYIQSNPVLRGVIGFSGLHSVKGSITIINNESLEDVKGFNNLITTGSIKIEGNPLLQTVNACFAALTTAIDINIIRNNKITDLAAFPSLTELQGQLTISNNPFLKSIDGFKKLVKISGSANTSFQNGFFIENNSVLESFDGLSSLTEISGEHAAVSINKNPSLKNLKGLSSLGAVNGTESQYLHINTNIQLEDIDGLSSLRPSISGSPFHIVITQNEKLIRCGGLLPYLEALGWDEVARQNADRIISITDNGAGCTLGDLINGGPVTPRCSGDVILYSQAKVDVFTCPVVDGRLTISGADITNLNTLSSLKKVTHGLNISDNPILTSLESLDALDTVGSLSIYNNASLTDLSGFSSLLLIEQGQDMFITNNSSLQSISGFNKLIRGSPMTITRNSKLVSITGFNSLVSAESFANVPAKLIIEENQSLETIGGFRELRIIGDVRITNNPSLLTLDGFSSLKSIDGSLEITNHKSLRTVEAFTELLSVGGFPKVGPQSTGLYIGANPALESINGLTSLKSVAGIDVTVDISFNKSLKDVDALSSLTTIVGSQRAAMVINNNDRLEDLNGISLLRPSDGILSIRVENNSFLKQCHGLFPYFATLGFDEVLRLDSAGIISINNNGAGCTVQDIINNSGQMISKFTVIDERTHDLVKSFENDSITLDLSNQDFDHWVLEAHTFPQEVGSVEFVFDNKQIFFSNQFPYTVSLANLDTGIHTVMSDVFSAPSGGGDKGRGKSAIIRIVRSSGQDCIHDVQAEPDVTSVKLRWPPYNGLKIVDEYRVKRNGENVGGTVGRYGYFTDFQLTPGTSYLYAVETVFSDGTTCLSDEIAVTTTTQTSIRTHYTLLAIVFDPNGQSQGELEHIRTFLKYRLDFLRNASHNAVNLEVYNNDIISIDAYPPREAGTANIDYAMLALTAFPELGNNTMVDLIEKYDVDIVWVLGSPVGYDFGENGLMGNRDLGAPTWVSTKIKCSRSFFIHSNSGDARAFDAAAHHVEGTMTSASEGHPETWPRNREYQVYTRNRADFSTYTAQLNLFEEFRLTDEWTGTGAYASKGNANCGSSHFIPGSIRSSTTYDDYTYYDIEAWKRYVDCYADDWLSYPNFSRKARKLNGYDYGAFNNYFENGSTSTFAFGTASFHYWWFNHIPHNQGVTDGKLNNWWPYIYDCNRFDGSDIQYAVAGFPVVPLSYNVTNDEFGTEDADSDNWMFWHTNTDFGQRADLSVASKSSNPEYVKSGLSATKVHVQLESFGINGRNDLIYPRYRNAHWNLSDIDTIVFSVKVVAQNLPVGTNPIFRLCTNGNNRIEFVPKKAGLYTNLFKDAALQERDGWYTFRIPVRGSTLWENNVIGYIDPNLSAAEQQQVGQALIQKILSDVNYFEVSIQSDGNRGESLVYIVDNIKFQKRDTTQTPEFSEVVGFDVVDTSGKFLMELKQDSKINIKDPAFKLFSIRAHTNPEVVSSVKFWLNGKFFRVENVPPYAFNGDINGVYNPWIVNPWDYTIRAVPYIRLNGKEYEGNALTVHFKVVSETLSFGVTGFDVVDTDGNLITHLREGDLLYDDQLSTIVANTTGPVRSVTFTLNNQFYRTENVPPYTLTGDQNGNFNPWSPQPGYYTLTAAPYSASSGGGDAGVSRTVHFIAQGKHMSSANRVGFNVQEESLESEGPFSVLIYPVPVDDALLLKADDRFTPAASVKIVNVQGLKVYDGVYSESSVIPTQHLKGGVYFLQVTDVNGVSSVAKFIKK